jgi:hypothetical protein
VRAEATIVLGVVKFSSDGRGDANRCRELISRKLADRDEIERAAAQAASDLTAEGRRQLIRGKSS